MLKEYILGVGGDFWITRQDTELEIGQSRSGNWKGVNFSPSRPHVSKALYFDMGRQNSLSKEENRFCVTQDKIDLALSMVSREAIGLQDLTVDLNCSARTSLPGLPWEWPLIVTDCYP